MPDNQRHKVHSVIYVDPNVKDTYRVNQPEGRGVFTRLDQNENQDGVPQWLFDMVMKDVTPATLAMYPEEISVTEKYAKLIGVRPENVTLTDGSVVGMGYLIRVFGEPGKNLLAVNPTFGMYYAYASLNGMKSVPISYNEDMTFPIDKILDRIDENTSIVVLVNPNMPVGNTYTQEEIEEVIQKAARYNALVIVDEAYHYFFEGSSVPLIKKYDNLAVLRTFSKMLSIPALRVGAVIGSEDIIHYTNNLKPHYTVNALALKFTEAIIDNHDRVVSELKAKFDEGMDYVLSELRGKGYDIKPSAGCFICIKPKYVTVEQAYQELVKRKILVLRGTGLLEKYIRLTVFSKKYLEIFLKAFFEIDVEQ